MPKPYRLIIWGPGQVGGAVARAALGRDDLKIAGAKVFSPHKDGKDLGELIGAGPMGAKATVSKEEILALEADCVVFTPMPAATLDELDQDVIGLLESGKNVVSTASYHNPAMPGRLSARRSSATRLQEACRKGGVSLHGTGLHPGFMVERLVLTLSRAFSNVEHIRFVEAIDFSQAPEGMWGGLSALGFGQDIASLNTDSAVLTAKELAYGDIIGNAAHALYGASMADVRIERSFRRLPADKDFQAGKTRIKKNSAAALHLTQRGYVGSRHFFTHEACWYLGNGKPWRGENLPFGGFQGPLSYTVQMTGGRTRLESQLEFEPVEPGNPFTSVAAQAVLSAIGPVCESPPGTVIRDPRPRYQSDTRLPG